MANLTVKRIDIRNWGMIESDTIEFPESGLVLVTGANTISGGYAESVGSGKTCLGEALSRAVCGTTGRYTRLGHYSRHEKGNTLVQVATEVNGKPLDIDMGFKCKELSKSGEGLRFKIDGEEIERGHVDETREELSKIVGVPKALSDWSVFLDGDNLRFNKLGAEATVNLLMAALSQPSWPAYKKKSSTMLTAAIQAVNENSGALTNAKTQLQEAKDDLQEAKDDLKSAEEDYKAEVKTATERKEKLQAKIKEADKVGDNLDKKRKAIAKEIKKIEEEKAAKHKELETKLRDAEARTAKIEERKELVIIKKTEARSALRAHQKTIKEMEDEPDTCPTCGHDWDKKHSAKELKSAKTKEKQLDKEAKQTAKALDDINAEIDDAEEKENVISDEINKLDVAYGVSKLSRQDQTLERELNNLYDDVQAWENEIAEIDRGPDSSAKDRAETILAERKKRLTSIKSSIKENASNLAESEELHRGIEYWNKAFSPSGIPNMILEEAIAPLNETARRLCNLMTGGTINIRYSTTRDLKKGGQKAELVVKVDNTLGASRIEGNSKGESRIINLIIAETLAEVGRISGKVNYRWYDEVLTSQDQTIRRSILNYLRNLAHQQKILVFVVDHNVETSSYADHVLIADKGTHGTKFTWS